MKTFRDIVQEGVKKLADAEMDKAMSKYNNTKTVEYDLELSYELAKVCDVFISKDKTLMNIPYDKDQKKIDKILLGSKAKEIK